MPASQASQEHAVARAGKIYAIVKGCAERGEVCPTNAILAERFGCGQARICAALHFLESAGMIVVHRMNATRIVWIRATGLRTAGEIGKPHWSARQAA